MSYVSIIEIPGRKGEEAEDMSRDYTREYQVIVSAGDYNETYILAAPGIPTLFQTHPDIGAIVVRRIAAQDSETPWVWRVTVSYAAVSGQGGTPPSQRSQNPTARPPEIEIDFVEYNKAVNRDQRDVAVKNSAGDRFDPPLEVIESHLQIVLTRNVDSIDLNLLEYHNNSVNDREFLGFAKDSIWIKLKVKSGYENNQTFWTITATLLIDVAVRQNPNDDEPISGGWWVRILDAGYADINGNELTDNFGNRPTTPILLNGAGLKNPKNADEQYRKFRVKARTNFDDLELI